MNLYGENIRAKNIGAKIGAQINAKIGAKSGANLAQQLIWAVGEYSGMPYAAICCKLFLCRCDGL